jgi:maltooligosyltrehalose trehalohydrolase
MTSSAYGFGPELTTDGVRFRLWAPDAQAVSVIVEGSAPQPMTLGSEGAWEVLTAAAPGALYRFEIAGHRWPDPASRLQPQDVGGPSQVVDEASYAWGDAAWTGRPWREAVIYEAHVGICGGYEGLRARLPELAALGVTALELMPLSDFPGRRNWGYDGVLPYAPDSAYGHRDALKALIDTAHGHGLMVLLDVVYNHFGPEGNGLPAYASTFFDPGKPTPWGPAIDFSHPQVRRFFTENALYWLEVFHFDGLRLDAVHAIADQTWLGEMARAVRARLPNRQVHLVLENEANDAGLLEAGFDAQWNDDFHSVVHVLLTGETHGYYRGFADAPAERLARCLAEGFIYQGEALPDQADVRRGQPSGHLAPTAFVAFLQNHDQTGNRAFGERLTQLARPAALRAAMALLLLSPQVPLLFMGEEAGAREPFLFFTDFHGELAAAVREGRRKEFQHAPGFGDADERQAIPDPNAPATFEASRWTADAPDAEGWHGLISHLLTLRRTHLVPRLEGARSLGAAAIGPAAVLARWRLGDGAVLTLAVNLGDAAVTVDLPQAEPLLGAVAAYDHLAADTALAWLIP